MRDRTHEAFGINTEIEVVRNFVNCDVYERKPELYSKLRPEFAAPNERLLVHLSNFRPVKRVLDVVETFAKVSAQLPSRLLMIGDGPERSAAEFLAVRLGVADRVNFLGKQENVNELLPLADLMLMPSEMESFGLAALEAMACCVPAVSTRVGGIPELIEDGKNGLLYGVGDVAGMAEGSIALLADNSRLETMRMEARRTAQKKFCASQIIPMYESYYEKVIARNIS